MEYSSFREILKNERLPVGVVDLDALDRNAKQMAQMVSGTSLSIRIATKSIRVPQLIQRILERGAPYRGLMCYSAEEARVLAEQGMDDFLVAYPTVQESDLHILKELTQAGKKVQLVCDSWEGLQKINSFMEGLSRPFEVCIEVDLSLRYLGGLLHIGVRRSPIRTVDQLVALIRKVQKELPCLKVVGLMGYEAQVAGLGDRNPFKPFLNPIFSWVRKLSVKRMFRLRKKISEVLQREGIEIGLFNGGGTGSVTYCVDEPWLTEVTVGSGFFCSHLFDYYSNLNLEPSCFFALQVVRSSDPGFFTCQGGGYVASGEPGWDKVPRPDLPQGLTLVPTEGCGEVQTPLKVTSAQESVQLGDPVIFRHAKAGELAERFNEYLLVSDGKVVDRVKTYRGLGWCFF